MKTSDSIVKISVALLKAQRKMGAASKDSANPYFKSKYADYGAVLGVVKQPLNDEGIFILQPTFSDATGHYVETVLVHESGEFIKSEALRLELTKTDMQALGSAVTYARRYQLQSLLGVPAEDDDGEAGMNRTKTTKANFAAPLASTTVNVVAPTVAPTAATITHASTAAAVDATSKTATGFRRPTKPALASVPTPATSDDM